MKLWAFQPKTLAPRAFSWLLRASLSVTSHVHAFPACLLPNTPAGYILPRSSGALLPPEVSRRFRVALRSLLWTTWLSRWSGCCGLTCRMPQRSLTFHSSVHLARIARRTATAAMISSLDILSCRSRISRMLLSQPRCFLKPEVPWQKGQACNDPKSVAKVFTPLSSLEIDPISCIDVMDDSNNWLLTCCTRL